jgi:hypothetical protein
MSTDDTKKLAKQFIDDQKRILEQHGDRVVRSKYKDAIAGAQRTFEAISTASAKLASARNPK